MPSACLNIVVSEAMRLPLTLVRRCQQADLREPGLADSLAVCRAHLPSCASHSVGLSWQGRPRHRFPEAECTIADGQLGSDRQAAAFHVKQQTLPRFSAFAMAVNHRNQPPHT
jgi:hypothetical protein